MKPSGLLLLIITSTVAHALEYSGGSGTSKDPYQIATAEDLIALGETPEDYDKHFILTADIDLDPNLPGRKVFDRAVIAPDTDPNDKYSFFQGNNFTGAFDGDGHTISWLTISGKSYLGIFGRVGSDAVISNLSLEALNINGKWGSAGGLASENYGNIIACHSTGIVNGIGFIGGLVGKNHGNVTASHSYTKVSGDGNLGGLIGVNSGGHITMCFSCGKVCVEGIFGWLTPSSGGLVGYNGGTILHCFSASVIKGYHSGGLVGHNDRSIANSYSFGSVEGRGNEYARVGGLVGTNSGVIDKTYSSARVHGIHNVGGLIGIDWYLTPYHPADEIRYGTTNASFWDTEKSGQFDSAGGTGLITAEMQTASTFLDAGWDFLGETANGPNDVWKIIEGQTYPLLSWQKYGGGTGEPNDPYLIYTVEHLNALGAEPNDYDKHFKLMADIDLSGYTYDRAVIAPDVNDVDGRFQGTSFTGVFNGNSHIISNLTINGQNYVGLFGQIMFADVIDLGIVDADITGLDYVGGLAGSSNHGDEVARCYSECRVKGINIVGGLIGSNHLSSVNLCYSRCTVTGETTVGGLVGANPGGLIENSYSTSQVSGNSYVCGLVARNSGSLYNAKGRVINCYNAGIVSGTDRIDALVWVTWGGSMPANCFWDMETSGQASGFLSMGRTTAEMQTVNTFLEAGWDFVDEVANGTDDVWRIDEGQDYPRLWWEIIPEN